MGLFIQENTKERLTIRTDHRDNSNPTHLLLVRLFFFPTFILMTIIGEYWALTTLLKIYSGEGHIAREFASIPLAIAIFFPILWPILLMQFAWSLFIFDGVEQSVTRRTKHNGLWWRKREIQHDEIESILLEEVGKGFGKGKEYLGIERIYCRLSIIVLKKDDNFSRNQRIRVRIIYAPSYELFNRKQKVRYEIDDASPSEKGLVDQLRGLQRRMCEILQVAPRFRSIEDFDARTEKYGREIDITTLPHLEELPELSPEAQLRLLQSI